MTSELTNPKIYCSEKSDPVAAPDAKGIAANETKTAPPLKPKSKQAAVKSKRKSNNSKTCVAQASPASKEDAIIKELTIAYVNWEESAKRHESELSTVTNVNAFLDFLGDSVTLQGTGLDIFDRGKGCLSWLQGMALWKVRPLPGAKNKPMELRKPDGTLLAWSEWLQLLKHPMSESTAYWYRRIYHVFTIEEAKVTGFSEMIAQLAPSFRKALKRDRAKWEKHHEFNESNEPPPPPPKKDAPITVGKVERMLDNIAGTLDQLKTVYDAPDLYKDIEESLRLLSDQQKRIDGLRRALDDAEKVLQATHQKVIKYRDRGVIIGQKKAAQVRATKQKGRRE